MLNKYVETQNFNFLANKTVNFIFSCPKCFIALWIIQLVYWFEHSTNISIHDPYTLIYITSTTVYCYCRLYINAEIEKMHLFQFHCCGVSGDVNSTESWAYYKYHTDWFYNNTGKSDDNSSARYAYNTGWLYNDTDKSDDDTLWRWLHIFTIQITFIFMLLIIIH